MYSCAASEGSGGMAAGAPHTHFPNVGQYRCSRNIVSAAKEKSQCEGRGWCPGCPASLYKHPLHFTGEFNTPQLFFINNPFLSSGRKGEHKSRRPMSKPVKAALLSAWVWFGSAWTD